MYDRVRLIASELRFTKNIYYVQEQIKSCGLSEAIKAKFTSFLSYFRFFRACPDRPDLCPTLPSQCCYGIFGPSTWLHVAYLAF